MKQLEMISIVFQLVLISGISGRMIKGVQFGENNVPWMWTPGVGHATVNVTLTKQITFCAWVYMDWIRGHSK